MKFGYNIRRRGISVSADVMDLAFSNLPPNLVSIAFVIIDT